ncbi:MAG: site-specific integrase [Bacteroidales bacterium]|nr:site-specific integrase [Bacteroidales bacterium]
MASKSIKAGSRQGKGFVFPFIQLEIAKLKQIGKERTSETYAATLKSFMKFRQGKDLLWGEMDSDIIRMYENYLQNRGLTRNSTSFYMRILRAVYNRAVEKELTEDRRPFKQVYTGIDKTVKRAISLRVIKKIKDLDLTQKPHLEFARDMFLFSFYTRGMSFIDMAYLKKSDLQNGNLAYRRRKTGQRLMIKWEKCMQEIVDRYPTPPESPYLLPIIRPPYAFESTPKDTARLAVQEDRSKILQERRCYQKVLHSINHQLKILSEQMGLPAPLTTYVARHTWANIARNQNIPISVISEGLGHHSEQTTQIYLTSLDISIINEANRKIIEIV